MFKRFLNFFLPLETIQKSSSTIIYKRNPTNLLILTNTITLILLIWEMSKNKNINN